MFTHKASAVLTLKHIGTANDN